MFGDIMGMMGKLKETQQKVEETKKRLDFVLIDEKSADGLLRQYANANCHNGKKNNFERWAFLSRKSKSSQISSQQ